MSPLRRDVLFVSAIAGWTIAAFLPALGGGFVWDDALNFLHNPNFRGLSPSHIRWMFTTAYLGPYQPLSWLSLAIDWEIWGLNPFGFHYTNLLLHAVNAVMAYLLSARLLRLAFPDRRDADVCACAALAALVFALHPLRVEAVAWVTERRTVLAAAFYLLALWFYLESRLIWTAALFACSVLSKGIGISLPITLLILDIHPLRRLPADPRRWLSRNARAVLWEKAPVFAVALGFGIIELSAYARLLGPQVSAGQSPCLRVALAFYALAFYPLKTLAPFSLSALYQLPGDLHATAWPLLLGASAVIAATAALVLARGRWPVGLAAWAHYVAAMTPLLGWVRYGNHIVADRYSYLACLGWPLWAAGGMLTMGPKPRRTALALASAGLAGLSVMTWRQCGVWHDNQTLWSHAASVVNPICTTAIAENNVGNELMARGSNREAIGHYRTALRLDPDYALAQNNLGILLAVEGSLDEALPHLRRAIELDPGNEVAYNSLGLALIAKGRVEEGVASYCHALRLNEKLNGARTNLRLALSKDPRLSSAAGEDCLRRLGSPDGP